MLVVTAAAVAVKLPDVLPAATVTDAGTVSSALEDATVTAAPPAGAAPDRVIVHVEVAAPDIVAGLHVRADSVTGAGLSTRLALFDTPL